MKNPTTGARPLQRSAALFLGCAGLAFLLAMEAGHGGTAASPSARGDLALEGGGVVSRAATQAILERLPKEGLLCIVKTALEGSPSSKSRFGKEKGFRIAIIDPGPGEGDDPDLAARIARCNGFYFEGGDPERLSKTFRPQGRDSLALTALRERFENGAVLSGSSAGAMIVGPITLCECASRSSLMALTRGDLFQAPGFDIVPDVLVDAHFFARGLIGRHLLALARTGASLGIGIDEETALVVPGDSGPWTVIGRRAVAVIEPPSKLNEKRLAGFRLSLLRPGDRFDPATGSVLPRPGRALQEAVADAKAKRLEQDRIFAPDAVRRLIEALADSDAAEAIGRHGSDGPVLMLRKTADTRIYAGRDGVTVVRLEVSVTRR